MKWPNHPQPYLIAILVLNLLQGAFSGLAHDESYYWVYAQHLDWGFFDHPPAVAVLIKMGYAVMENELGVRLFIILSNLLATWLIYKITAPKDVPLFFLLFFSCIITHVGFMAVPDIPLLLFVSLFFYFYKEYLENNTLLNALALALSVAAMGYSKYHGIVPLIFVLFSNLSLLRRRSFWGILLLAAILYFPHLYWQWQHDFPTFRFHLFDRSTEAYRWAFIPEYIGGQLLIFGPFAGFLLFWGAWKYRAEDQFEKTMKWCFYGIFAFFLASSFKGRVEPYWTVAALVPLIYLAYRTIESNENARLWTRRLAIPSVVVILLFRFLLISSLIPTPGFILRDEFHGWKAWAMDLSEIAGEMPVVFFNNYQRASKYRFYSGKKAVAVNDAVYAGNQYALLDKEAADLQGDTVLIVEKVKKHEEGILLGGKEKVRTRIAENFRYYNPVRLKIKAPVHHLKPNELVSMAVTIHNPTNERITFVGNGGNVMRLHFLVYEYKHLVNRKWALAELPVSFLEPGGSITVRANLEAPDKPGNYRYRFAIHNGMFDERNGNFQKLRVE